VKGSVHCRRKLARGLLLAAVCMITPWLTACQPTQQVSLSGWFHVIWYDGPPGSGTGGATYWLDDDLGQSHQLLIDEKLLKPLGGPLALNGKRVKVIAEVVTTPPGALRVLAIELENPTVSSFSR
jgi:hypothetical protein